MEIVNPNCAFLSNFEVHEALKQISDTKKKHGLRNLATISYETIRFLEEAPSHGQTRENLLAFTQEIKPYNLTKPEILMIVNDPPVYPLDIQLKVEDSEERLSEERVQEILELAQTYLISSAATTET